MKTKIEDLDAVLSHPAIKDVRIIPDDKYFCRMRSFAVDGVYYIIKWYHNQSYLYAGSLSIPFHTVRVTGFWPNQARYNLDFRDHEGEVCCVLPIEYWGDKKVEYC